MQTEAIQAGWTSIEEIKDNRELIAPQHSEAFLPGMFASSDIHVIWSEYSLIYDIRSHTYPYTYHTHAHSWSESMTCYLLGSGLLALQNMWCRYAPIDPYRAPPIQPFRIGTFRQNMLGEDSQIKPHEWFERESFEEYSYFAISYENPRDWQENKDLSHDCFIHQLPKMVS